LVVFLM